MYSLVIERAAEKDMQRLPEDVHGRVSEAILQLKSNPRPHGSKKLTGMAGSWRIRVGDYRVLYDICGCRSHRPRLSRAAPQRRLPMK